LAWTALPVRKYAFFFARRYVRKVSFRFTLFGYNKHTCGTTILGCMVQIHTCTQKHVYIYTSTYMYDVFVELITTRANCHQRKEERGKERGPSRLLANFLRLPLVHAFTVATVPPAGCMSYDEVRANSCFSYVHRKKHTHKYTRPCTRQMLLFMCALHIPPSPSFPVFSISSHFMAFTAQQSLSTTATKRFFNQRPLQQWRLAELYHLRRRVVRRQWRGKGPLPSTRPALHRRRTDLLLLQATIYGGLH
jgi:hypothetical protein